MSAAFTELQKAHPNLQLGSESNYRQWINPGGKTGDEPGKGAPGGFVSLKSDTDPTAYVAFGSVVMDDAKVEKNARILNQSSVQQGARVGVGTTVGANNSVGKGVDTGDMKSFNNGPASATHKLPDGTTIVRPKHFCPHDGTTPAEAAHATSHIATQTGLGLQRPM